MTCRELEPVLGRIASSEAAPRLALDAARHLAVCTACAEDLLRMREVSGLLDRLPQIEVPATFTRRVLQSIPRKGRIAGGALLVLAAAGAATIAGLGRAGGGAAAGAADVIESTTAALLVLFAAARSLAGVVAAALSALPIAPLRLPAIGLPLNVLLVVSLLVLALAASGAAAFGTRALALHRARAPLRASSRARR